MTQESLSPAPNPPSAAPDATAAHEAPPLPPDASLAVTPAPTPPPSHLPTTAGVSTNVSTPLASTPDSRYLEQVAGNLAELRALHAQLQSQRESIEAEHRMRAQTPLALRIECVSCQFAAVSFPSDASAPPTFTWGETPCPFGKRVPDQDCRDCVHHQVLSVGASLPAHTRRYTRYGPVFPLPAAQLPSLANLLAALDVRGLRRVDAEIAAVERAIMQNEALATQARARELERQQRGRF